MHVQILQFCFWDGQWLKLQSTIYQAHCNTGGWYSVSWYRTPESGLVRRIKLWDRLFKSKEIILKYGWNYIKHLCLCPLFSRTHFSVYKDIFAFYKDTKCAQGHAILMPAMKVSFLHKPEQNIDNDLIVILMSFQTLSSISYARSKQVRSRGAGRSIIGGGGQYSYIRVHKL